MKRIGHGGAPRMARSNTLASFDAAVELGADVVEFDVRPWRGELVLAHTRLHPRLRACPTLGQALDHLRGPRFAGVELDVDVKAVGCEAAVLDALRSRGLIGRAIVTSQQAAVADRVRALDPKARVGVSIGGRVARALQRWGDWRSIVVEALHAHRFDALMAQHRLVDARLADAVREAGAELYGWTVDDRARIERLRALGVAGVVTNDLRLFAD